MPNYRRPSQPNVPVFFTVCLADRKSTALVDYIEILRNAVRVTQRDRSFDIFAWVVLPDHMHAVWKMPTADPNFSQRWGRIKARFSRDACRAGLVPPAQSQRGRLGPPRRGESGIWQRRFWERHIRDAADLNAHIRYCHVNPVKHGLVARPEEWAFSSVHREIAAGRWAA